MSVSKRLRHEVMKRDKHSCRYCGAMAPDVKLTIDHVIPVTLGGDDSPENLVTACVDCNAGKSSVPLNAPTVKDIGRTASLWEQARREVLSDMRAEWGKDDADAKAFLAHWSTWTNNGRPLPMDRQWRNTLLVWKRAGLSVDDLKPMVDIAMNRNGIANGDCWRYFCGIVWRTLDELEARTAEKVTKAEQTQDEELVPPLERVWIASAHHVFPHPSSRYVDPDEFEDPPRDNGYQFDDAAMWEH